MPTDHTELGWNLTNYDLIADEYYTGARVTSRNFDRCTANALRCLTWSRRDVPFIECGPGRGRTREFLALRQPAVHIDLSERMLRLEAREQASRILADSSQIPVQSGSAQLVTAWLCDPFLDDHFLREVARLLAPGGEFIASSPSLLWGRIARRLLRIPQDSTAFIRQDGQRVLVPSHLDGSEDLVRMVANAGLDPVDAVYGFLPADAGEVSPHVRVVADHLEVSVHDVPLVLVCSARKDPH